MKKGTFMGIAYQCPECKATNFLNHLIWLMETRAKCEFCKETFIMAG